MFATIRYTNLRLLNFTGTDRWLNVTLIRTLRASWCRHRRRCRRPRRPPTLSRAASSGSFVRWPRTTPTSPSISSRSSSATATGRRSPLAGRWPSGRPSSSGSTTTYAVDRRRWGTWRSERSGPACRTAAAATSCTPCENFVFRPGSTISFSSLIRCKHSPDLVWSDLI